MTIVNELIQNINTYYGFSFKLSPAKLNSYLVSFLNSFQELMLFLNPEQVHSLNTSLMKLAEALERNDFVAVRDVLYYEIRPYLMDLSTEYAVKLDARE